MHVAVLILCALFVVPGNQLALKILSDTSFASLKDSVSDLTLKGISDMGFSHMTEIQAKTIPHLLEGRLFDVSSFNFDCKFDFFFISGI
jgi:hypothetical protein